MRPRCRLILARHGQTKWNLEKRFQGSIDVPLTETGRKQAHTLATALKTTPLKAVYSSQLSRAVETAEIIARPRGLAVNCDPNLREGSFGSNEGKTYSEVWEEYATKLHYFHQLHPPARLLQKLVPDQESDLIVIQRTLDALTQIASRHRGNVLVITHGGVIRLLLYHLAGLDFWNLHIQNAVPHHFIYTGKTLQFAGCEYL